MAHDFEFSAWTPEKVQDIDDDGEGRSHRLSSSTGADMVPYRGQLALRICPCRDRSGVCLLARVSGCHAGWERFASPGSWER